MARARMHGRERKVEFARAEPGATLLLARGPAMSGAVNPKEGGPGRRHLMEQIISRIVGATGIDEGVAKQGVGVMLNFLTKEGDAGVVGQMVEKIPGASDLLAEHTASEGEGGGGGLMGGLAGAMGGGGIMGLAGQLQGLGLDMGEIQGMAKEFAAGAREQAGDGVVDAVAAQVPGLDQFM